MMKGLDLSALAAALRRFPDFAGVTAATLEPMPYRLLKLAENGA